ncbi:MAG: hypothetical protein U9N32_09635 [Spirochaetota bacterium]|nr:hypothetical protein [Spirochaetota bacterium]
MTVVKANDISGQQSSHQGGEWCFTGSKQKMGMIGKKSPAVTSGSGFGNQFCKPIQKIFPIFFISEDIPTLNPTNHHMMENSRGVKSCGTWHGEVYIFF